jgi:hypothetical protein
LYLLKRAVSDWTIRIWCHQVDDALVLRSSLAKPSSAGSPHFGLSSSTTKYRGLTK